MVIATGSALREGARRVKRALKRAWYGWRQRGWTEVCGADYARLFGELGGSIHVHPLVLEYMEQVAGRRIRYITRLHDGVPIAALPMVDGFIGATPQGLAQWGLQECIDMGDGELVLPVSPKARIALPGAASMISELHAADITGLDRGPAEVQMLAVGSDERSSGGLLAVSRRKFRRFQDAGGTAVDVRTLSPADVATNYRHLFHLRWGRPPLGATHTAQLLARLAPLMRGYALFQGRNPVAIQIIYSHPAPRGSLSVYVNGGIDPGYRQYSPGSILYYLNIDFLCREASAAGLPMRFSFGRNDASYKEQWCRSVSVFHTT